MKDFLEYISTSLIFGLGNDCDITLVGQIIPNVITEETNNCL